MRPAIKHTRSHAHREASSREEEVLKVRGRGGVDITLLRPLPKHVCAIPMRKRLYGERVCIRGVAVAGGDGACGDGNFAADARVAAGALVVGRVRCMGVSGKDEGGGDGGQKGG